MADILNILVVDDQKVIGDLFEFTLGYKGHAITVVDNAVDALTIVHAQRFDIAFLDIVMPDTDGVALLAEMRRIAPRLPVIMMSGYSVEEKKTAAQKLGAVMCLRKPFEIDDVKNAITAATGKIP